MILFQKQEKLKVFLLFGRKFLEDEKTTKQIAILGVLMQIIVILELVIFHI